ncbi:hypothetical protein NDU88_002077 [Pleurodeles waltl]|uniref:Uncharacterized protein n=1 Tax=Pleurodeles waltl TaxID=8319 RepID=A0AAV7TK58_PLEWA|nr:hypothetical protein NDU88_002077 [Pleurodeles waltl]
MPSGDGCVTPRIHEASVPPGAAPTRKARRPRLMRMASARPQPDSAKALSVRLPQVSARHRSQPPGAAGSPVQLPLFGCVRETRNQVFSGYL